MQKHAEMVILVLNTLSCQISKAFMNIEAKKHKNNRLTLGEEFP